MRVLLIVLASVAIVSAQSKDVERLKFEVASVRPNKSDDRSVDGGIQPGGRFVARNFELTGIIRIAYSKGGPLQRWQIIDAPSWTDFERFDIAAVSDRDLNEPVPGGEFAPVQLMLQSLLADRFNLRAHFEERQTQVYALVRDGATNKLTPIMPCGAENRCGLRSRRPGGFSARGSLGFLAAFLGKITGRTVTDDTGLVGDFDINLRWAQESPPGPPQADTDAPSLFGALREQLGLRLDTRRGSVSMLVIDSVDRPTSN
jgi:uncharacterized protein (TIGR03435 family)